jgi:hypothetical protein
MAIFLVFTDLRLLPSRLLKFSTDWKQDLTAFEVVSICMGIEQANTIENDLNKNNPDIIISWYHKPTGDICEIGGVRTLSWKVTDNIIIGVAYENQTSSEEQIDELIKWTQSQEELN